MRTNLPNDQLFSLVEKGILHSKTIPLETFLFAVSELDLRKQGERLFQLWFRLSVEVIGPKVPSMFTLVETFRQSWRTAEIPVLKRNQLLTCALTFRAFPKSRVVVSATIVAFGLASRMEAHYSFEPQETLDRLAKVLESGSEPEALMLTYRSYIKDGERSAFWKLLISKAPDFTTLTLLAKCPVAKFREGVTLAVLAVLLFKRRPSFHFDADFQPTVDLEEVESYYHPEKKWTPPSMEEICDCTTKRGRDEGQSGVTGLIHYLQVSTAPQPDTEEDDPYRDLALQIARERPFLSARPGRAPLDWESLEPDVAFSELTLARLDSLVLTPDSPIVQELGRVKEEKPLSWLDPTPLCFEEKHLSLLREVDQQRVCTTEIEQQDLAYNLSFLLPALINSLLQWKGRREEARERWEEGEKEVLSLERELQTRRGELHRWRIDPQETKHPKVQRFLQTEERLTTKRSQQEEIRAKLDQGESLFREWMTRLDAYQALYLSLGERPLEIPVELSE